LAAVEFGASNTIDAGSMFVERLNAPLLGRRQFGLEDFERQSSDATTNMPIAIDHVKIDIVDGEVMVARIECGCQRHWFTLSTGHAHLSRARKTIRVQRFGSDAYSRRQLFLNAAIAASRVGLSERAGAFHCDGHHKMSDLGAAGEPVHKGAERVEPVYPRPGDWMAVRRFDDGDSE
jgi:hypothetical protein